MPIVARCSCGKQIGLSEVMAGRTISCPKCGEPVLVPTASSPMPGGAKRKTKDLTPAIAINPMILIAGTVGMILVVIVLALYLGPWTVGKQWSAMSSKANSNVTDVVEFAIRAYESENGMYDAAASRHAPAAEGEAHFVEPYMAFALPRYIPFVGKTNQGNYIGKYDTTNGEITADIETGGYSVGGLVDVKKASGTFHMSGREKDGTLSAECDGKPLNIVMRKKLED